MILLVDKPSCCTTRSLYNHIQYIKPKIKIGHCGTLDPMASGLVLVLINKANKLQDLIHSYSKLYYVEFLFGIETETNDLYGKIKNINSSYNLDVDEAIKKLNNKKNTIINQRVPKYSAKKYKGISLYKYIRNEKNKGKEGENIKIFNKVNVFNLQVVYMSCYMCSFYLSVSSGFYIRSFVRDFGIELNIYTTVSKIVRIKIGPFCISNALSLNIR